jgi:hypothetical protein
MKIKTKARKIQAILYPAVLLYVFPLLSRAQTIVGGAGAPSGGITNPLPFNDLFGLITALIDGLMKVGVVAAACFIIYSGFLFITAQGDPKQIETAKSNFYWTVIGTAILLGAKVIVEIIRGTITSL